MTEFVEKHYCIDAGMGEKMSGCPYSLFEDGHDVQEYIIPPDGYEFTGFKVEPLPNTQIYNGKLVAQYKKLPFKERASGLLRGFLVTLGILAVIGIIVGLSISVFKPKKPQQTRIETPVVPIGTLTPAETLPVEEFEASEKTQIAEPQIAEPQIAEPEEVIPVEETPQTVETDVNLQFKQEFWALIHQRAIQMDDYDGLYKQYKGQVSGEEFDYLRYTILKDSPSYKEWYTNFRKIPKTDLESLETIEALKNKIKEIQ